MGGEALIKILRMTKERPEAEPYFVEIVSVIYFDSKLER